MATSTVHNNSNECQSKLHRRPKAAIFSRRAPGTHMRRHRRRLAEPHARARSQVILAAVLLCVCCTCLGVCCRWCRQTLQSDDPGVANMKRHQYARQYMTRTFGRNRGRAPGPRDAKAEARAKRRSQLVPVDRARAASKAAALLPCQFCPGRFPAPALVRLRARGRGRSGAHRLHRPIISVRVRSDRRAKRRPRLRGARPTRALWRSRRLRVRRPKSRGRRLPRSRRPNDRLHSIPVSALAFVRAGEKTLTERHCRQSWTTSQSRRECKNRRREEPCDRKRPHIRRRQRTMYKFCVPRLSTFNPLVDHPTFGKSPTAYSSAGAFNEILSYTDKLVPLCASEND